MLEYNKYADYSSLLENEMLIAQSHQFLKP